MDKSIIIIGAGTGLSLATARKFGKQGYKVGLISRNKSNLEILSKALSEASIENYYETADVSNPDELHIAINSINYHLQGVDILLYNAANLKKKNILEETVDTLTKDFQVNVIGLQLSYNFLNNTLKKRKGAVFVSGGGFALHPSADYGSLSLGKAALRNLTYQLSQKANEDNIYVGLLTISGLISKESKTHSPELLADKFWALHSDRTQLEIQL